MLGVLLLVIFCIGFLVLLLLAPRTLIVILVISILRDAFKLSDVQMLYFLVPYFFVILWDIASLTIRVWIFYKICLKIKKWWTIP
ncbi:MAG: hypothetical protein A2750_01895 [Candidatus Yanofskybacteria bacterium RIFCSPHIGHO2_01_FULL_45_42]|uniref:Uncharacterized protein n=3 Tax=Candidatus Yanofskyibacteriota TaxID=1752733 RepID=A0A1F8H3P5_9BACT|nr:MAG: hypothetical protein A2750_01895 [Candidatus Yanofskybacteria bacterium RIFCSPHIGHO2_01_FULL_45_42]OGN15567.1 MAG: hypothetical protein A3C81_00280 [Candidatus Yanofskybacteria bacterium RIFCSPHIGHO2_02_FULL_46_19]OGN27265.1 MAG: hypothetical protein A3B17_00690 [Candidatus Yanofskybacteria bacterium RIFCSPLOWO2_01_FULL_45_72]OGN32203.1 MAG: hypothetical protein A3J01_01270 [Candidatus Yanofskybacteria bacterium RIFCSPLOWO2_02_FULL_45_18]